MDKITAIGIGATGQKLLAEMQQTAALAASGSIGNTQNVLSANPAFATPADSSLSFPQMLNQAINSVDGLQHSASAQQKAVEMGQSDDLAGAMIETQKASVAFSALLQVRNRLTSALDDVMNTPL